MLLQQRSDGMDLALFPGFSMYTTPHTHTQQKVRGVGQGKGWDERTTHLSTLHSIHGPTQRHDAFCCI